MRLRLFRLIHNGAYTAKRSNKNANKKTFVAKSRTLVVTLKMRFFRFDVDYEIHDGETPKIHGGGAPRDELTVMSVHLHHMCAEKRCASGSRDVEEVLGRACRSHNGIPGEDLWG